jgi:hypothetical protein
VENLERKRVRGPWPAADDSGDPWCRYVWAIFAADESIVGRSESSARTAHPSRKSRAQDFAQKDHPHPEADPSSIGERIVHFLHGLADLFEQLGPQLRKMAKQLQETLTCDHDPARTRHECRPKNPPAPVLIESDKLPIMVRGFVPPPPMGPPKGGKRKAVPPSDWTLIFDCETKVDAGQNLRFGAYQVRKAAELKESGLFYDSNSLTPSELALLRRVAAERGVELRTCEEFVEKVFYGIAYDLRASIVGFNLPFDLSRLAIRHGPARGKTMKGGFTFQISNDPWKPRVQVRHLNAHASRAPDCRKLQTKNSP